MYIDSAKICGDLHLFWNINILEYYNISCIHISKLPIDKFITDVRKASAMLLTKHLSPTECAEELINALCFHL